MNNYLKTVLFDLDDTLFDNQHCNHCALSALQSQFDYFSKQSIDDLQRDFARLLEEIVPKVLNGELSREASRLERFHRLTRLYNIEISDEEALVLSACYREAYRTNRHAILGATELLQHLRGMVKIGIVTNHLVADQQEKLRECNLDSLIDFMVVSEEVGVTKPTPLIFEVALQRADCAPHEAVMIGDSWKADVLGAHAVGIRPIWFNRKGATSPDPSVASELSAYEPLETVLNAILG